MSNIVSCFCKVVSKMNMFGDVIKGKVDFIECFIFFKLIIISYIGYNLLYV